MSAKDQDIAKLKQLIEVLDDLRSNLHPEGSVLLQNMRDRYGKLHEEAQSILGELTGATKGPTNAADSDVEQLVVYISLFQADPENLRAWEKTLHRLGEYSLSRPIYRKPEHVLQMIRTRPDPRKEAYAQVIVNTDDLIKSYAGKSETDINGNELLTVKEGAMTPKRVQKFVHGDQAYVLQDEKLVPTHNS